MSRERLDLLIWDLGMRTKELKETQDNISYFKNNLKYNEDEIERIIKEIIETQKDILEEGGKNE